MSRDEKAKCARGRLIASTALHLEALLPAFRYDSPGDRRRQPTTLPAALLEFDASIGMS
jgi:hypothetical protein